MKKKKAFLITVLMLVGFSILPAQENPSIIIVNYTGKDIDLVIFRYTQSGSTYMSLIEQKIPRKNGESFSLTLPKPLREVNRYDSIEVHVNGKEYTKENVKVTANTRIEFGTPPPQANPRISIINNTGETINAVSIRSPGSDWLRYAWDNNTSVASGESFSLTLPNPLNKVNRYDIRLERPNSLGTYTKNTVTISHGGRVEFTSSNRDSGSNVATNTPRQYDFKSNFSGGFAAVSIGGKWDYDDYDEEDYYVGGKWGFIDTTGKEITPIKYDSTEDFNDGFARVKLNSKWGFINTTGKEITPIKYDNTSGFSEGLAKVKLGGKWGFVDKTGREVISLKYDDAYSFSEESALGLAKVKLGGKWGYIDKTGKEITPIKYDDTSSFSEGLAKVKLGGKWGFIDTTGKEITPIKYDDTSGFYEGLAKVKLGGKCGYINTTGKEVIPLKYDDAYAFRKGKAKVKLNGREFYIDKTDKEVSPPSYEDELIKGLELLKMLELLN